MNLLKACPALRFSFGVALLFVFVANVHSRVFTDTRGRTMEAELITVDSGYVKLQRSNGSQVWVKLEQLSEVDQRYVREQGSVLTSMHKMPLYEVIQRANEIDRLIRAKFRENRIQQNPPSTDEQFIRRIYLDILGRIPSYDEVTTFLDSKSTSKRRQVTDELLKQPGYISHNFNYWGDILRLKTNQRDGDGAAYIEWVKQSIRENKRYDLFVQQLLKSEGYPWDNAAVGYYIRDRGMPLDNMSNTMQVFMGTRLVCAQCHDHPFEDWTQMEYYQMAAYTYGVETTLRPDNLNEARKLVRQAANGDRERQRSMDRAIRDIFEPITFGARETKKALKLPHDYKYDDAKPKSTVKPGLLFGETVEFGGEESPRDVYVRWMTSPENELFVKVIANRIWKKVMGHGIFEPIDDLKPDSVVSHPELLKYLMKLMSDVNFDLKQYERVLYNTPTYHRQVSTADHVKGDPYYFPGPMLRRMSAEQLWDSMLSMTIQDCDERVLRDREEIRVDNSKQQAEYMLSRSPEEIFEIVSQIADIEGEFAVKRKELREKIEAATASNNTKQLETLEQQYRGIGNEARKKVRAAQSTARKGMMEEMMMSMNKDGKKTSSQKTQVELDPRWKGFGKGLVRAAELPSPAPNGHFLQMFGQSDRDVIENASVQPTVPQALALLNGPMFKELMKPNSVLMKHLMTKETPEEKLDVIFLTVLSRRPSIAEKGLLLQEINRYDEQEKGLSKGYKNVIVALMNTRQYAFIR